MVSNAKIESAIDRQLADCGSILGKRAMLLRASVGSWIAQKKDVKTSKEIDDTKGSTNGGKYTINLCLDQRLLDTNKEIAKFRNALREMTLPYLNARGLYIAPNKVFADIEKLFGDLEKTIDANIPPLCADWDSIKAQELTRLAQLAANVSPRDYPTAEKLRERYYAEREWSPVPNASQFADLEGIDPNDVKALAESARDLERRALVEAQKEIIERITRAVSHVSEAIGKYVPKDESPTGKAQSAFRDSLIDNVRELCEIVPKLNVADDQDIADIVADMNRWIAPVEPDDLRVSKVARMAVRQKSDEIAKRLSDLFG